MHRILFIIAFLLAAYGITHAQNFNYTVNTDSVAWNELNAQTILNTNNSAWNFSYRIPIGFTFHFCGRDFDSLTIETNGYIVFDQDRNYAITAFSGVGDCVDTAGVHAVLGYQLTGSAGNHILKIQYKNCSNFETNGKTLSWQIWLKENDDVEIRVGNGTLRNRMQSRIASSVLTQGDSSYLVSVADSSMNCTIGILNMNMDGAENGRSINGSPTQPTLTESDENHAGLGHLDFIPPSGYRFTFSPNN